jgi:hypothetical protein
MISRLTRLFAFGLLLGAAANAATMFIQTAAGTGGIFSDTSRIQAAGANDTPTLILDGSPVTSTFFSALVQPFSGTKTSSTTTLIIPIHVVTENSITVFNDPTNLAFDITVNLVESVSGGVATFSTTGGAMGSHALTNGQFLEITPLANSNLGTNSTVQAQFQLVSSLGTQATPEPGSMLLIGLGLVSLAVMGGRLRNVRR